MERESVERERESGERDDTILVLDQVYTLVGVYIGSDVHAGTPINIPSPCNELILSIEFPIMLGHRND